MTTPNDAMTYRTKPFDFAPTREPVTDRFCVACHRGLKPTAKARDVHLVDGGGLALHPKDELEYEAEGDPSADLGGHLLGLDCARKLGLEWSSPERSDGDVQCTACEVMFWSGDGPPIDIVICPDCWTSGKTGPLGVVS
jgi:hypothetical protein